MKNLIIACLLGTVGLIMSGCASDEPATTSTTTTEESTMVSHPVQSTTTQTVQQ